MFRTILDLCGGTGSWSKPYRDAGYHVIVVDPAGNTGDVRLQRYADTPIHGILCAPPCTVFSYARNRYEPTDAELLQALSVADACLRHVVLYKPKWWALENPRNKLRRYLGNPRWEFNHCDFGEQRLKPSGLWGDFNEPTAKPEWKTKTVSTFGTKSENASPEDAITPARFAQAFFEANP